VYFFFRPSQKRCAALPSPAIYPEVGVLVLAVMHEDDIDVSLARARDVGCSAGGLFAKAMSDPMDQQFGEHASSSYRVAAPFNLRRVFEMGVGERLTVHSWRSASTRTRASTASAPSGKAIMD
jgi:hypothetical protein